MKQNTISDFFLTDLDNYGFYESRDEHFRSSALAREWMPQGTRKVWSGIDSFSKIDLREKGSGGHHRCELSCFAGRRLLSVQV